MRETLNAIGEAGIAGIFGYFIGGLLTLGVTFMLEEVHIIKNQQAAIKLGMLLAIIPAILAALVSL